MRAIKLENIKEQLGVKENVKKKSSDNSLE